MKNNTITLMQRLIACISFVFMVSYTSVAEYDPDSARSVYLAEMRSLGATQHMDKVVSTANRPVRGSYAPDPNVYALVSKIADETGISRETMHYIVKRESGYRADARNPKSTATGLLQLIRGSHAAIIGRELSKAEHHRLASNAEYNLRVGAAHIKACKQLMPNASADAIWRRCHIRGHAAVGGRIEMAAAHYSPDSSGWLARGSVAVPWATAYSSYRDIASKS